MSVLDLMFCMLSMMNLVTVRRARMDTMFLYALVRRFGDLVGGHRLRRGRRRVGDAGLKPRICFSAISSPLHCGGRHLVVDS